MDVKDMEKRFVNAHPDSPEALIVVEVMMDILKEDNSNTMVELGNKLRDVVNSLKNMKNGGILSSVGELFLRYITLNIEQYGDIEICRNVLTKRGMAFLDNIHKSRSKIANFCHPFIQDGSTVLTHSYSRVVLEVFRTAAKAKKNFRVYATQSMPDSSGQKMKKALDDEGIPCCLIYDATVGHIMEKVDMVLVGAESVVESGGIINKIGTYQIAISARELNKPFYVLAESFKFARLYPLNQRDLRNQIKEYSAENANGEEMDFENDAQVSKDYTPPSYITLLFTNLAILTPSAVSDELIKIYT